MAKRWLYSIIFLVSTLVALYCGLWVTRAEITKKFIEQQAAEYTKKGDIALQYDTVSINGFPFQFIIEFTNGRVALGKKYIAPGAEAAYFFPKALIKSNFLGTEYRIDLPEPLEIHTDGQVLLYTEQEPKSATLTFQHSGWTDILDGHLEFGKLVGIHSRNNGSLLVDKATGKPMLRGTPSHANVVITPLPNAERVDIDIDVALERDETMQALPHKPIFEKRLGGTIAISLISPTASKEKKPLEPLTFEVSKLAVLIDELTLNVNGKAIIQSFNDQSPSDTTKPTMAVDFDVAISDFPLLLAQLAATNPNLPAKEKERITQGLLQVKAQVTGDTTPQAKFPVRYDKESGTFYVGKLTLAEFQAAMMPYIMPPRVTVEPAPSTPAPEPNKPQ